MELVINKSFDDLLPKQTEEELEILEQSLLTGGCNEPIKVWEREPGQFVIIDGHSRYGICKKHGIEFLTATMDFSCEDDARNWIIKNQMGRRNLSPTQKGKIQAVALELSNRFHDFEFTTGKKVSVAEAKKAGISHDTASKLNAVAQKDPAALKDVAEGKLSLNKAHKKVVLDTSESQEDPSEDDGIATDIAQEIRGIIPQVGALAMKNPVYGAIEASVKGNLKEAATKLENAAKLKK